ncbi:MAG: hypothetical protein ACRD1R_08730 [Acidobacteriota bacterium]
MNYRKNFELNTTVSGSKLQAFRTRPTAYSLRTTAWFLIALFAITTATAATVRMVNLSEMVQFADRVFWGQCLSSRVALDPSLGLMVETSVFKVHRGIKGISSGDEVVVRQAKLGASAATGQPSYRTGEEVLLFLHGDSRLGLTSPVGEIQGRFAVTKTADGKIGFINGLRNRNLSYGLSNEKVRQLGLTAGEHDAIGKDEPIPLSLLSPAVQKISRFHQKPGKSPQ